MCTAGVSEHIPQDICHSKYFGVLIFWSLCRFFLKLSQNVQMTFNNTIHAHCNGIDRRMHISRCTQILIKQHGLINRNYNQIRTRSDFSNAAIHSIVADEKYKPNSNRLKKFARLTPFLIVSWWRMSSPIQHMRLNVPSG